MIEFDGISLLQGPGGLMQGANTSALYLVSLLPYIFTAQFWVKRREMKALTFCLFTMGIFTLIITNSRGGWVGFLLSFPILFYLSVKRGFISYRKHFVIVVMIGLVLVAVVLYLSPKIYDRLFGTPSVPIHTRTFLNRLAIEMMNTHPILGVGVNNFAEGAQDVIRDISDPQNIYQYVAENPVVHNVYLLIGAETGLLGLIVFLLIPLLLLRKSWSLVHSDGLFVSCFGIASLCFLLGLVTTEMFDFSYRLDQLFYLFWTLAGLIVALTRLKELREETTPLRMVNE
jgi:O-antigen ligase